MFSLVQGETASNSDQYSGIAKIASECFRAYWLYLYIRVRYTYMIPVHLLVHVLPLGFPHLLFYGECVCSAHSDFSPRPFCCCCCFLYCCFFSITPLSSFLSQHININTHISLCVRCFYSIEFWIFNFNLEFSGPNKKGILLRWPIPCSLSLSLFLVDDARCPSDHA